MDKPTPAQMRLNRAGQQLESAVLIEFCAPNAGEYIAYCVADQADQIEITFYSQSKSESEAVNRTKYNR